MLLPLLVPEPDYDFAEWEKQVAVYQHRLDSIKKEKRRLHLVRFDANKVTRKGLISMGIPEKVATNWANYLKKGGRFRKPVDISKVYGLSDSLCHQIIPYVFVRKQIKLQKSIVINTHNAKDTLRRNNVVQSKIEKPVIAGPAVVHLNETDSVQLERLPGIGPVLAGRIIKYRRLLGGYSSVLQLREVYGLREEHFEKARPFIRVSPEKIKQLRINLASVSDLARHPYITYEEAQAVVRKRDKLGKLKGLDDLTDIFLPEKVEKLRPYIIFAP